MIVLTLTSQHDKAKRWQPRFSVRTLVVVVTLVCCYAACWGPTKKWGVADIDLQYRKVTPEGLTAWNARAYVPLVVSIDTDELWVAEPGASRHYYLWLFGYTAKLPYEGSIRGPFDPGRPLISGLRERTPVSSPP